jgi:hypothetical protein
MLRQDHGGWGMSAIVGMLRHGLVMEQHTRPACLSSMWAVIARPAIGGMAVFGQAVPIGDR